MFATVDTGIFMNSLFKYSNTIVDHAQGTSWVNLYITAVLWRSVKLRRI